MPHMLSPVVKAHTNIDLFHICCSTIKMCMREKNTFASMRLPPHRSVSNQDTSVSATLSCVLIWCTLSTASRLIVLRRPFRISQDSEQFYRAACRVIKLPRKKRPTSQTTRTARRSVHSKSSQSKDSLDHSSVTRSLNTIAARLSTEQVL